MRANIAISLGIAILISAATSAAEEQNRPILLPLACETSLALSAAPSHLQSRASVLALTESGYVTPQTGDNGFTCIVNRDHPHVLKPTCFDREGAATVVPKIVYTGERMLAGDAIDEINEAIRDGFDSGRFVSQRHPGVAYMLSLYNRPVISATGELGFFPPHVMFHAPNMSNADIGHDMDHHGSAAYLPRIAYGGPQGYMLMLVPDQRTRQRSDLDASCPDWIWQPSYQHAVL